jgi:signal transduction histidine kinase
MASATSSAPAADHAAAPLLLGASTPPTAVPGRYRPSVRLVLLAVTLTILVLPLGSLVFFRIYENQLVRETEAELIAQGAVLAALIVQSASRQAGELEGYGTRLEASALRGPDAPIEPLLDLATHPTLPQRPAGLLAVGSANGAMSRIADEAAALFREAQKTTLAGLRLLDHRGVVIGGRDEIGLSLAHVEEVAEALRGHYASALRQRLSDNPPPSVASISRGTGARVFAAFPVLSGDRLLGVVYLSRTPNNILRHMYVTRDRFLLAGLTILGLALLIGYVTTRTLVRPINRLSEQARQLGRGGTGALAPLDHYGTEEVAALGRSLLEMAGTLEARAQYIRDFAAHVSHEFRTPLASIRGSAELLAEHLPSMSEAERTQFLRNIVADTDRLRALVSRLLELARADNTPQVDTAIDAAAVIDRLATVHRSERLAIVRTGAPRLDVCISEESFEIVAVNLIQNSAQAGATRIEIDLQAGATDGEIAFRDNGSGVSALNAARLFEPFFTTRRESGGTGLGLRIVRSLLSAQGGSIRFAPGDTGATFVLTLPARPTQANRPGVSG